MALVDRYIAAHKALRPRGVIWEIRPGSVTEREIRIEAEQLAEIHQSVDDLIKEADLRQVFHLLEEWENVFELPHTGTYEERLAALNAADSEGVSNFAQRSGSRSKSANIPLLCLACPVSAAKTNVVRRKLYFAGKSLLRKQLPTRPSKK